MQASVKLGLINEKEIQILTREEISAIWRDALECSSIDPVDVHSPLWFWSRGGFEFDL